MKSRKAFLATGDNGPRQKRRRWEYIMNENFKTAIIAAFGGLIVAILAPCLTHWLEKVPVVQTIDIAPQTVHIGDESRPDYPDQPDGRRREATFSKLLPQKPSCGVLYLDAYDVDLIGADVLFNGKEIGSLRIGDDWQENAFDIKKEIFSNGQNQFCIRSRKQDNGQEEDFLIKNIRLEVRYK